MSPVNGFFVAGRYSAGPGSGPRDDVLLRHLLGDDVRPARRQVVARRPVHGLERIRREQLSGLTIDDEHEPGAAGMDQELALAPLPLHVDEHVLHDQHLGGAIMLLVGGVSYLAGGLWLTARALAAGNIRGLR